MFKKKSCCKMMTINPYGSYNGVTPRFNRRPVGVDNRSSIGPFHGVLIPQADPNANKTSLKQHGYVGCRSDGTR